MADKRVGFLETKFGQSIAHIRTKADESNKYKRMGMLIVGLALIAAGIIVALTVK